MEELYKIEEADNNKYQNYSNYMRPSFYASTNPNPNEKIILNDEDNKRIESIMGKLYSEGDELIQESIAEFIYQIQNNFDLLNQSNEFNIRKESFPGRLIKLLKNFLEPTLLLLVNLLSKSSEFDLPLIKKRIAQILAKDFDILRIDSERVSTLSLLLSVLILLSRKTEFCNNLIETNFYENLPLLFGENIFDDNRQSINEKITSLLDKTSKRNKLLPLGYKYILDMVPLLLKSDDTSIIDDGFEILSQISIKEEETLKLLDDEIIGNLISFISNEILESDAKFLIITITKLSSFASLGEKVLNMMNKFDCLKKITELVDFYKNDNLISSIFDLAKYWAIFNEHDGGVEMIFIFLSFIDFIYIFENCKFIVKEKAIRILRLAASVDPSKQMIDILNYDLFVVVLPQITDDDNPSFMYDGCFLIREMIRQLSDTPFFEQIKECLMTEKFGYYLESVQMSGEDDLVEIANDIFSSMKS